MQIRNIFQLGKSFPRNVMKKFTKGKALLRPSNYINYYFFPTKNDVIITNTTKPTNPPFPSEATSADKLAITSIPNTEPPVRTFQRIVTGNTAIMIVNKPPKNPVMYL